MSSFKQLSRSDVTVVANNANKQWNLDFYCFPASSQYLTIYKGTNLTSSFSPTNDPKSQGQYERLIYTEINQLFYQSYTASLNTSSLARSIYYESASEQRPTASYFIFNDNSNLTASFPSGANETIRVISINQNVYGNKVLPGSFVLTSSAYNIKDDSYGNLRDGSTHIGNIFYAQGLAVITNQDYQLMFPVDSSSCATTTTTTTTTTTSTTTTTTTVAPTTTTTTTTSTTTTTTTVEPTTSTTTTTTTVEPTTSTTTTTTTEPTTSTTTTTTTVAPTTTSTTTTTTTEPITTTSTTTTTTTAEPTTTTSTTTTTTTAEPTTTTSTTTTTTTCTCYEYDVDIIQSDLDNATGNTDPFRNGRVFVSYRNCDDSGFTTLTYTTASYYGNAFCMNSNPIYSPVFDVWQNDVQLTVTSSTAINTGNCCSFTPTTTTTTSTTTTTTTAEPTTTSTTTTTTTAEPTTSTTTTTTTAEPTTSTTTTTTTSNIADITVSNSSLDIAITSVTVNGVAVTHTSGTNFTINAGDPTGYFTTNELGTYDIVVYYNSSISGQNIIIIDCASNSQCCTTTGSGGSCTLVGASISGGCTINIAATDGACV